MDDKEKLIWGAAGIVGASMVIAAYTAAPARFTMIGVGDRAAYRLDTHTGLVTACYGEVCRPVEMGAGTFQEAASASTNQIVTELDAADPILDQDSN